MIPEVDKKEGICSTLFLQLLRMISNASSNLLFSMPIKMVALVFRKKPPFVDILV